MTVSRSSVFWILFFFALPAGILVAFNPYATLIVYTGIMLSVLIFVALVKKTYIVLNFLSVLLLLSLFLLPSVNLSGVGFRIDDYIAIFFTLGLIIIGFRRNEKGSPTMMKWLYIYLIYSALITLVYIIFGDLNPILILFFVKEIQYFVYFLIFYLLAKNYMNFENNVRKTFLLGSIITLLWGVYQLLTNNIVGYYGIGIISAPNPSQSGVALFIISLFLYYMSVSSSKKSTSLWLGIASIVSIALTFATISRTAISVVIAIVAIYLLISIFKKWNFKRIFIGIYISILVIPLIFLLVSDMIASMLERFSRFGQGASFRTGFWSEFLNHSSNIGYFVGNGKGFMQEIVGSLVLRADSQYVRLIVEVGIIGLVLWLILIGSIMLFGVRNLKHNYVDSLFLILITIGFMIVGVTQEGYLVTIQGSLYWMLTGFFIGIIVKKNNESSKTSQ